MLQRKYSTGHNLVLEIRGDVTFTWGLKYGSELIMEGKGVVLQAEGRACGIQEHSVSEGKALVAAMKKLERELSTDQGGPGRVCVLLKPSSDLCSFSISCVFHPVCPLPSCLLRFISLAAGLPLTVSVSLPPLVAMLIGRVVYVGCLCSCHLCQSASASAPPLVIPVHNFPSICFFTFL